MEIAEWSNDNKYNEFNSYKGLTYYNEYLQIVKWMRGDGDYNLPAIECSLDPITLCNLKCFYCNSQRYLDDFKEIKTPLLKWVIRFIAEWGMKGLCFGGGGESLLHKDTGNLLSYAADQGLEVALITNGTVMNDNIVQNIGRCQWVGFSVDAATNETYRKIKGVDLFDKVIGNLGRVAGKTRLAYRMLLVEENAHEIYQSCLLARSLSCNTFHVRPADFNRKDYKGSKSYVVDADSVREQFLKCHELEDDDFKVQTVIHKFNNDFTVKQNFTKCLASPLCLQVCTDGFCYVCPDHRLEERFRLGHMSQISEWWGKDKHRNILRSIIPSLECSRCTWSEYNRQISQVAMKDGMNRSFP